jgi:hypothetical protein
MRNDFRMLPFVLLLVVSAWAAGPQTIDLGVDRSVWVGRGNVYYSDSEIHLAGAC